MIGDFILAFVLLGGGLLALLLKSTQKDREDAKKKEAQAREEQASAEEDASKYRTGARLVCLSCGARFRSPLTESGCPQCHLSLLVMTETQFNAAEEAAKKQQ